MAVRIEESWRNVLSDEFDKDYFLKLTDFVKKEYQTGTVYPHPGKIFKAFDTTPFGKTKVVILGQDPYHGPNQACGLCFAVNEGVEPPPSLVNIYQEIASDTGKKIKPTGNLDHWAEQGVLLLNATLTVRASQAGSHQNKGWEEFTDRAIKELAEKREGIVFMLWGSYAQKKGEFIDRNKHLVLEAPHPSPLSAHRGFFGCRHFTIANTYLIMNDMGPIEW